MKLATQPDGTPDGALIVVSRDLTRAVTAAPVVHTLQEALERWAEVEAPLRALADQLEAGRCDEAVAFDPAAVLSPMPRAWQWLDGSTFRSHAELIEKAYGVAPMPTDRPLMYQGMSHRFLGPTDDAGFPDEADGIDFEGEFGVIVDETPMGVDAEIALRHIKLVVQINDWSLRVAGEREMKTGFGWIQGKPACTLAPVAITPDELGESWEQDRVGLALRVWWNETLFGAPNGREMAFGFGKLIAHAARTRSLCAGTIIGSGTVSNASYRLVGSTCIAERRGLETIDTGAPRTGYLRFGDRVRMEAQAPDGSAPFGAIDARVVMAGGR